ncbi:MAG: hypothetical protein RLZZ226_387 [Pseudomonadota bacterium]
MHGSSVYKLTADPMSHQPNAGSGQPVVSMARVRRSLLTLAVGLSIVSFGVAAQVPTVSEPPADALSWLSGMRQAASKLSYKGILAFSRHGQVESFQLFHAVREGVEHERLISMNSPLREVVRNAEKVVCYYPDTQTAYVENKPSRHSLLLDFPEDLHQLTRYYHFSLQDQAYVAKRLARIISITPRDDYRYARRIWLDVESGLPLKSELLDETGADIEQMVFSTLELTADLPLHELEASIPDTSVKWEVSQQREMLSPASLEWSLEGVPEGFRIISYSRTKRPGNPVPLDHLLLSDGLSSVSIYLDEGKSDTLKSHPRKMGAFNMATRKVGTYQVTVMGEVPERTVAVIAEGLHHQEKTPHD